MSNNEANLAACRRSFRRTRYRGIDYGWRPQTYWDPADEVQAILGGIRGRRRREMILDHWQAGRLGELDDVLLQDELTAEQRRGLEMIHPSFMGGEYLPPRAAGEVAIARMDMKSVTSDVVEVLAQPVGRRIRYRIVDEYNTEFPERPTSARPITLGQLIGLIDRSSPEPSFHESLALVYNASNYECAGVLEGMRSFISFSSDFYANLSWHYDRVYEAWYQGCRATDHRYQAEDEEEALTG